MHAPLSRHERTRVNSRLIDHQRRPLPRITVRPRTPVRHVTLPFCVTAYAEPLRDETIAKFIDRSQWGTRVGKRWSFRIPTICVVNGVPVLQREWARRRIKRGDIVEFWSRPWGKAGGSGKQIMGLVAIIALAAFAPWAGGALAGVLGLGTIGTTLLSGAILMGGALLISALTRPDPGGQAAKDSSNDQIEQLNTVAASGNSARLFQPITNQYGRIKSFPDYAINPWSEFEGNDQFLNILLVQGLGKFTYHNLYIDDTILWDSGSGVAPAFTGVSLAFYDPNTPVTLFPINVVQSVEVSGQQITTTPVGGFVANPSGTLANALAVDIVFPAGLFKVITDNPDNPEAEGEITSSSVTVVVEAQPVDGAGAPIGPFVTVAAQSYTMTTRNPQRSTIKFAVANGRYAVRVSRTTAPASSGTEINDVVWQGLRGFIDGPTTFPASTVAIRIKASSQLTTTSARRFGTLATRQVNVWNGSTFVMQASRNPIWAAYDAATDSDYGIDRPPSKVDFQAFFDQATAADVRGDAFDYRFGATVPAPEALDTILKVARCRHRWSGDVLTIVRDEWADLPRMLLTDREIVRGSMSIDYQLNDDTAADAVIIEYLDENTWGPGDVQFPANSITFTSVSPTRMRIPGIVKRDHAFREVKFYYTQSQRRRVNVSFDTEHDGRMLGFGSRVRVQTELPLSWGSTGAVIARITNKLTVEPAPTWGTNPHFIAIRTKTGRQFGPVLCTQGVSTAEIVLDAVDLAAVEAAQSTTLTAVLSRAQGAEDPSFDFGPGESRARNCLVMTGRPQRDRVTLGMVVDYEDVHDPTGTAPVAPTAPLLRDPPTPLVAGLYASFHQGVIEPTLDATWWPAAGAVYYVAEVSYDGGTSWVQAYEGANPGFSKVVDRASLRLRVQGIGVRRGAFTFIDVEAPTIAIAPNVVSPESLQVGLHDYVINQLSAQEETLNFLTQRIAGISADQDAANALDRLSVRTLVEVRTEDLFASIQEVAQIAVSADGRLTAAWFLTLDVNGFVSGLEAYNDGSTSDFTIVADRFRVAFPGQAGGAPVPVFQIANVAGVPKITFRGDMVSDGTITAQKLNVAELTAITANLGNATVAGVLTSQNGKMVLDFTNNRITFSD